MSMPRDRDEPVRLTRIYTGGGDRGETSLGDGSRVPKIDCRIGAFGAVDELNSHIGLALAGGVPDELRSVLERVQNELFDVGADLSVPFGIGDRLRVSQELIARAWKRIVQTHEVSRDAMAKLVMSAQAVGFLRDAPDLARFIEKP